MSQPIFDIQKQKDLKKRGIPLDTFITPDNNQILLERESLRDITAKVSERIGRKFTVSEVKRLVEFIRQLPASKYCNTTLIKAQTILANEFLNRYTIKAELAEEEFPTSVIALTHLDEITTEPGIDEYQKKEIKQFTKDENQNKYSAFANKRGDAVVDADRVKGIRSSPDSLPSGKKISIDDLNKANYETLKIVKNFLDPDSIDELLNRYSSTYTNFYNINLPHQVVSLDSRNRLLTNTNTNEYTWNLHNAGRPGHLGDIQMQDTIQQIIQMKLGSFWLPMGPIVGSYYNKIRLLIKEFTSQSTPVTEFLTSDPSNPTVYYYHFEFDIGPTSGNKVFLTPVNNTYTFRKPFARLDTLTISFRTPFNQLIFQSDRGIFTITYGNPTVFTITSATSHGLSTGDLIYVLNSSSGNAAIDSALTLTSGYFVTKISNTQFSIVLDTSTLVGTQTNVQVYYGSQRVFFPIEFTSLEQ